MASARPTRLTWQRSTGTQLSPGGEETSQQVVIVLLCSDPAASLKMLEPSQEIDQKVKLADRSDLFRLLGFLDARQLPKNIGVN